MLTYTTLLCMGIPFLYGSGRVAHLIAYTVGIVYLRTLVWFAAWCGGVMILLQLFK